MKNLSDLRQKRKQAKAVSEISAPSEVDTELHGKVEDLISVGGMNVDSTNNAVQELRQINSNTGNGSAAAELNVEESVKTNETLTEINETTKSIYSKLSEFAEKLKDSFKTELEQAPITPTNSSDSSINIINEPEPPVETNSEKYLKQIVADLSELKNRPRLRPPKPEKDDSQPPATQDEDVKPKNTEVVVNRKLSALNESIEAGFDKTISIADEISKMLFKYTVSAALNLAKMAGLILALVLAIDVISIHLKYWGKMFQENFTEFKDRLGSLAKPMADMLTTIKDLSNYWTEGEYQEFVERIGKAVGSATEYLFEGLLLGLGKIFSEALRAMGFNEAADSLEAASIMRAMEKIGYSPDEAETKLVGDRLLEKEKAGAKEPSRYEQMMAVSKSQEEVDAQIKEYKELGPQDKNVTAEQLFTAFKLKADIDTAKDIALSNETSPEQHQVFEKEIGNIEQQIIDARQSGKITEHNYKKLERELNTTRIIMDEHKAAISNIEPEPVSESPDTQRTEFISNEQNKQDTPVVVQQPAPQNNNTNIVNKSSSTYVQAPRTSSPAPGLSGVN